MPALKIRTARTLSTAAVLGGGALLLAWSREGPRIGPEDAAARRVTFLLGGLCWYAAVVRLVNRAPPREMVLPLAAVSGALLLYFLAEGLGEDEGPEEEKDPSQVSQALPPVISCVANVLMASRNTPLYDQAMPFFYASVLCYLLTLPALTWHEAGTARQRTAKRHGRTVLSGLCLGFTALTVMLCFQHLPGR